MKVPLTITLTIVLGLTLQACAQSPVDSTMKNPIELGEISWLRDLNAAENSERPILLLFQEVPG